MAQKDGERPSMRSRTMISHMKVARCATARVRTKPVHQIQFDEGSDNYVVQDRITDLKKAFRKNIFRAERLNIFFNLKAAIEEAPETTTLLWDVEFAKQLAVINEESFQNVLKR